MQKLILLFSFVFLLIASSCSPKTTAAAADGTGGRDWATLAANYKKNPDALRQFVENCESNEGQLATAREQLNQYRSQSGAANQEMNTARNNLAAAQSEAEQLRQQLSLAEQALAAAQQQKQDQVDTDQAMVAGVIFQVQLGAYAQNTVDPSLSTGDALELQEQNGLQKVVVSQFRTYSNAAKLRDRLKRMGVKDAFVVAKNNGVRLSVPEALKLTGQN